MLNILTWPMTSRVARLSNFTGLGTGVVRDAITCGTPNLISTVCPLLTSDPRNDVREGNDPFYSACDTRVNQHVAGDQEEERRPRRWPARL
jgi:hypothetical protein